MGVLIFYEIKKFFAQKKNVWALLIFIAFIAVFVAVNINKENTSTKSLLDKINIELSVVRQTVNNYENDDRSEIFADKKYNQEKYDILKNLIYSIQKNEWKSQLTLQINLNQMKLENEKLDEKKIGTLKEEITINKILLEKNINPIFTNCSMQALNFSRLVFSDMMPILIILLILLLTSDSVSNEAESGTFKFLLSQPVKRLNILFSKIIAQTLICLLFFTTLFLVFFLGLGLLHGFGSPDYPILFYTGQFIGINEFVLYMIPLLFLLIIAINSFSILCSVLSTNSAGSISLSLIITAVLFIITYKFNVFKEFAQFNPLFYMNVPDILNGTLMSLGVTYWKGFIVLPVMTIICYWLSAIIFKRKNFNS